MSVRKTTQYGGDVVMFLLNKIIKNKNLIIRKKMLALHMVLKPCTRPPKQPMVVKPCARLSKKPWF